MKKREKVIGLFGPVLNDGTRKAHKGVVEALQETLTKARSGEVVGIGLIEQYRDGSTSACAVGKVEQRAFLGCLVQMLVYESQKG